MEKKSEQVIVQVPTLRPLHIIVALVLIVQAFLLGSLWTKVEILQKGGTVSSANTQVPSQPAAAAPQGAAPPPQSADNVPKVSEKDHIRGNKNARIALIEYSDIECPFCKSFHPTAQKIVDTYKDDVMWVFRHYPLSFHQNAQKEAEAVECANELGGNDAFWRMLDTLYERTTSNGLGFALEKLGPLASELGLPQASFQECLDSGKYTQLVKDQMAGGASAGVSGTPGNILLDTKTGKTSLIPGAVPFEQIKPVIDEMLKS